jgi:hypothetical protein
MRTRTALFGLGAAALAAPACTVIEWNFYFVEVVSTSTTSGSTTSTTFCVPGATQACYGGPAGTEGQGICKAGVQACAMDGTSWGACVGEVLPRTEDCATPEDEDCDGQAPPCKGKLLWAKGYGDGAAQVARSVTFDAAGNIYVGGFYRGTIDFGGGPLANPEPSSGNAFVVKLDASGAHLWSKGFGGTGNQEVKSVALDKSGNALVVGAFEDTIDFGGGPLTVASGDSGAFLAKLDPSGAHLWSKVAGTVAEARSVAADAAGNVFATGMFAGTIDFGGGSLTSDLTDAFVVKLDPSGAHLWSLNFSSGGGQEGVSVAVDGAGNVVVAGSFWDAVDLGGGPITTNAGSSVFVGVLDPNGGHLWSEGYGTAGDVGWTRVAVDAAGNLLIVGSFDGTIDFGGGPMTSAGGKDLFLVKLGADGSHVWSKHLGDGADQAWASVAIDAAGNVVVVGSFAGAVDFGGGPLASAGGDDIFVAKLDPSGEHLWSKRIGNAGEDGAEAVGVDAAGNACVAGYFSGTVDFGGGPLASGGASDIFVAKFSP